MCLGAESFTLMAVLEARDQASSIIEKLESVIQGLGSGLQDVAKVASAAAGQIDTSLLETASGADAVELANAKVEASQAKVTAASREQAAAEEELLSAQAAAAAAGDMDTATMDRQVTAVGRLAEAQKAAATATAELKDAEALQAATAKVQADATDATSTAGSRALSTLKSTPGALTAVTVATGAVAAGFDILGVHSAKMAGDFQQDQTKLATSAGETQANLGMVGDGVLKMAGQVGLSTDELEKGLYLTESAGFHASDALKVLQASAEGARAEGADLAEVSNAVTSALNAYGLSGDDAVTITNQMVASVGAGKMTMQDFASSLSAVLPIASSAGILFEQVGGAIATMTAQGMSAQQASQDLANTIRELQKPNQQAQKEMEQLGLDVNDVSQNLGKRGLTGTLDMLTQAITTHMGPAGTVMMDAFNKSKSAGNDLQVMLSKMPANLKNLAQSYMDGSTSLQAFQKDIKGMSGPAAAMGKEFLSLYDSSQGFNHLLTSGSPAAQTYTAALGTMLGGSTGLNTALMIAGDNMGKFQANVKTVGDAALHAGSDVNGWSEIQGNFNVKMAQAHQTVNSMFIALGSALLPALTSMLTHMMPIVNSIADWVTHNQQLAAVLLAVGGGLSTLLTAVLVGVKIFSTVKTAIDGIGLAFKALKLIMMENPWILIATLAITAIIFIVTHWQQISKFFEDLWNGIKSVAATVWGAISDFFVGVWNKIKGIFSTAIDAVVGFVKDWYPLILGILSGGLLLVPALIFKYWNQIVGFVSSVFNAVFGFLQGIWNSITGFLIGTWNKIVAMTKPIWEPIVHIITDVFQIINSILIIIGGGILILLKMLWEGIVSAAKAILTPIVDFFTWLWNTVSTAVTNAWNTITSWLKEKWDEAVTAWHMMWDPVVNFFKKLWDDVSSAFTNAWNTIVDWLKEKWDEAMQAWHTMWDPVINFFKGLWDNVTGVFRDAWNGIVNAVSDGINNVVRWSAGIGRRILDAIGDVGSMLWNAGKSIIEGFLHGLESAFDAVKNFVGGIADWISAHKGPISVDAKLLTPHGNAIMGGLLQGLQAGAPAVSSYLDRFTKGLSTGTTLTGTLGVAGGGFPGVPAGGGAQGTQVIIDLRGSQVVGDDGIRLLTDKIGRKIATQILPSAGVRIQM